MDLMERWYEDVWNKGREEVIDEMLDPGIIIHGLAGPNGEDVSGIAAYKQYYRALRAGLSNLHVVVEQSLADGDLRACRCVVTADHTGEGLGKPPKGKRVHFTGMAICRFRDGKMIEAWNNFDFATMLQQME